MLRKIFVSYRRDDERATAARVRDRLASIFGDANIFMDVDNLSAGARFDIELEKALNETAVFLAIIGPRWVELFKARQAAGERDFVLEEVASALQRGVVVMPVLVERTPMPRGEDLPEEIRELALHQKHTVAHESFGRDIAGLVEAIRKIHKRPHLQRPLSNPAMAAAAALVLIAGALLWSRVNFSNVQSVTARSTLDAASTLKADDDEFATASRQNSIEAFGLYLAQYPNGFHANSARERIGAIRKQKASDQQAEAAAAAERERDRQARRVEALELEKERERRANAKAVIEADAKRPALGQSGTRTAPALSLGN